MVATTANSTLPHWDMSVVFPGLESPEFEAASKSAVQDIDGLEELFDRHNIALRDAAPLDDEIVRAFDEVITRFNAVLETRWTLSAYINAFVATDSRDTIAQAKLSESQQQGVRLSKLGTRLTAWIGSLDVGALVERSGVAREHAFMLEKAKVRAEHLMSPAEEELTAELSLSGGSAWSKLHNNVTSQLMVSIELGGEQQELPMPVIRNLAYEADRDVRRRAYEAELATWERAALPLAAALNSLKGEVNTVSTRRGWESALDTALFDSNIDRQTFDAMLEAARESFPDFRRYLRAKAKAIGVEKMAWYDIFAPVGEENKVWEYGEATQFIIEQFGAYSSKMSDFAARAFREQWVDAEPRPGKRDGAFCMPLRKDESRVFTNYKPAFGGVSTLAHELGHGYHNLVKAERTMLQKTTPMTLAETASIFCETIVRQAALKDANEQEQLAILEASLQGSCQVVVDITSRFLFEKAVFEGRRLRELSIEELNDLMLDAQKETYGDGLDQTLLHPYMWAVKPHYYRPELSFYNYPYMFGLLFGLGLYARYLEDPEGFKAGYDDLLSSTGLADAATLAARFGIDIRTPDFWRASLNIIKEDIDRFMLILNF
ncbi:MAG TPA: M3 family oligoendopeptidase [Chloroflexia bacterium]|nr:M3 family oligoendopeptidase [Chloroflexia bacterium]